MKNIHLLLPLYLCLQSQILGQGPFGQYSESQIIEIITEARMWMHADPRNLNAEEKASARKFFEENKPFLDSLGKRTAFYYLRMIELDKELQPGRISELAYGARCIFWFYRDEYTEEEKTKLEQAKFLLSTDAKFRELKDEMAHRSADGAIRRKLVGTFHLSNDIALNPTVPPEPLPQVPPANPVQPKASESAPSSSRLGLYAAILIAVAATIFLAAKWFARQKQMR